MESLIEVDSSALGAACVVLGTIPATTSAPQTHHRVCSGCDRPILAARLALIPNTRLCTNCMRLAGDVPVIRRYDEYTADGERIETYYLSNQELRTRVLRSQGSVVLTAPDGDDAHLGPTKIESIAAVIPAAVPWSEVAEECKEE